MEELWDSDIGSEMQLWGWGEEEKECWDNDREDREYSSGDGKETRRNVGTVRVAVGMRRIGECWDSDKEDGG